ncbi:MAG TPA: UDP-N-acetylglucosamine 2-epimerase (non-hydrolyzing) [Dehalococcoidia bacterium]|nr:UDP-N-acetylglucosamine 2-epimerase (non-hydrolyzing) [Dehalococcoidia bacterium]
MKVMTILGTRPEIIRLSLIIKKLDRYCSHTLVHTGQNFDDNLSSIFFSDLGLREPDYYLGVRADTFGEQIGKIIIETEKVILKEKPDRILILGDTNSGLVSIVAKRMGIPTFHMEAGNRCFDYRVPEEVNRKIIDHCSTILLPYTYRSKENLLNEGITNEAIYVTGNPIYEVIEHYSKGIKSSKILSKLKVQPQKYFLVTMHRAENVDDKDRLENILAGLDKITKEYNFYAICSLHPRTRSKIEQFNLRTSNKNIYFSAPFGFFDFIALEKNALCVITDSGTVQEECCILRAPNITIRDVTERPETIESGSNILTSISPDLMLKAVEIVSTEKREWEPPAGYLDRNVSSKVVKIILGYLRDAV